MNGNAVPGGLTAVSGFQTGVFGVASRVVTIRWRQWVGLSANLHELVTRCIPPIGRPFFGANESLSSLKAHRHPCRWQLDH